ncbi:MAG: acyl carrier protein [Erysipelotrichaceae bacterium]
MEKLKEILEEIHPMVDYDNEDKLIDNHILDSLDILSLIAEIEDEFDVVIPPVEIVNHNFNSLKDIHNLISRLQNEA